MTLCSTNSLCYTNIILIYSIQLQSSTINTLSFKAEADEKYWQASTFVQTLSDAQIVYRIFDRPVGNVQNIPYGITYCVQGYFLPSSETKYEFVSYHPLMQYYGFTLDVSKYIDILPHLTIFILQQNGATEISSFVHLTVVTP